MSEWIDLKLLDGWKPVAGFRKPQYRIGKNYIDLRGYASGDHNKPIAYIGAEYAAKFVLPSMNYLGWLEEWSIDIDGYLWFKEIK